MKIAFTGPECSGKSTVSKALAERLQLPWVKEFAREYLEELNRDYKTEDIIAIAAQQYALWRDESFIADTEMLVCSIWYEEKTGKRSKEIETLLKAQTFDTYILCKPDIPWEYDELRENPNDRERLFALYQSRLEEQQLPFTVIEGNMEKRTAQAYEAILHLLKNNH